MKFRALLIVMALAACSQPAETTAPPSESAAEAPRTALAQVRTPTDNARVTSPLRVEGAAPGDWYFEAVFPARLIGADGAMIAEGPAHAQTDWTVPGDKDFVAELTFSVTQETLATLVIEEDMPGEGAEPRRVSVPVVLVPAS